ncbi:transcriptional regulator, GntR family (plasmid) [Paracoccus aminophilus JCM 7686]|uniref:Transcriptional regulator, GntR family n=1 Tax=Paracoccus aminophilus JCM 7686 TaxID=1367847 RepID=S5YGS1_PARAH|nr:transcriptional regulator, GntR family [Paracoccus aminophilus JCM 7686]
MVLVEQPSYFPILAILRRRALQVVDIHSDPVTGIDSGAFRALLETHPIRVALLMTTNHFPTGVTYSPAQMEKLVSIAAARDVIIVENDMFGDLSYDDASRITLKHFDASDNVVQIGSFEFTLPPEYGYGWIACGRHKRQLLVTHYMNGHRLRDGFIQRGIADYLAGRSYDRLLRKLNQKLGDRMRQGIAILSQHLPADCRPRQPAGGFMCWLELPSSTNMAQLSGALFEAGISVLPGPLFSLGDQKGNYAALNFSFPWTEQNLNKIEQLARIITRGEP